jgi:CheY-like chemotaxis protein
LDNSVQVLVVEDEPIIGDVLTAALEDAGYSARWAASGEEALKILEHQGAECRALVTDVRLARGKSKLTGWDVARQARERNPDIPVVYTSGDSGVDWSAQGVPKSIMVTKPYAIAQVIAAVSQLLNAGG